MAASADLQKSYPAPRQAAPQELASLRRDGRRDDELRPITLRNGIAPHATGSTLISWGHTQVICGVTIENAIPRWMKDQGVAGGWITAEYSMLPYSTLERKPRDISKGRLDGRSQEIQRLIGRAMRAAVDLAQLGSRTIWIDCDVLQADGGTRTAAITGSYVALHLAVRRLLAEGQLAKNPLTHSVAALSLGIIGDRVLLDLDYEEDSKADVDLNLVMTGDGDFIEVQGTGERATFRQAQLDRVLELGRQGIRQLTAAQHEALSAPADPG